MEALTYTIVALNYEAAGGRLSARRRMPVSLKHVAYTAALAVVVMTSGLGIAASAVSASVGSESQTQQLS